MKTEKSFFVLLLLLIALSLSACGKEKEEQADPISIVNYTLPDVSSFEETYQAEQKETPDTESSKASAEQVSRWKPHGVFTYVTGGKEDGRWSTALFKISSVDYETHCAVLTYTVKDSSGYDLSREAGNRPREEDYFFESGGERVVGLDETEEPDGTRRVVIYLSNEHYLEFIGKEKLEKARYCYKNISYRLKYEG